ncbi:MAG: hypothetical protein ACPKQO_04470 [Nitrososphaeraceae archaeon]
MKIKYFLIFELFLLSFVIGISINQYGIINVEGQILSSEKVADTNSTEKVADTNSTDVCKMPPCPEGKVCIQVCPESIGKNIINSSN